MYGVDDGTGEFERASPSVRRAEASAGPACVDEPAVDVVLCHALCEHVGVARGVENDERRGVARRERWNRFEHTIFGTGCLRSVTSKEVVRGLLRRELRHRWQNTEGVAREHNDIARLTIDDARNASVVDVLNRICAASVFRDANVLEVGNTTHRVVHNVLQNRPETDRTVNLRLLLLRESDALSVASTLNVKYTVVTPHVLVVSNKLTARVRGKRRLTRSAQSEE